MTDHSNNEALIKYVEERKGGLALEAPIEATPMSRKNTGGAMRMDSFSIVLKALFEVSELHMNAAMDIARAYRIRKAPEHHKTTMNMWMSENPGSCKDEAIAYILDIEQKYKKWSDRLIILNQSAKHSMTIDVVGEGKNFKEIGINHRLDQRTVKKRVVDACKFYVEVNKKPKQEREIHKPKDKRGPIINPTKIIVFKG